MRNRVFWNSPQTRLFSCLTLVGLMTLALPGCGGGGGNSGPGPGPGPGPNNVAITGTVKDNSTSNAPVVNALISIVGTSFSTHTDSSGHFSFTSVPNNVAALKISNPNPGSYFSYAYYGGKLYDVINCTFPLPTVHSGTNAIPEVDLVIGGSSPPPPPPTGCP